MLLPLWRRVKVKLHFWMIDCCKQSSAGMISIAKTAWNIFYITFIQIFCNLKHALLPEIVIRQVVSLSIQPWTWWCLLRHSGNWVHLFCLGSFLGSGNFQIAKCWKLISQRYSDCLLINKFLVLKEFSFNELIFSFPILITNLQNYNVALNCP